MYAVVATGGKQYKVEQGQVLEVERVGAIGSDVDLRPVLLVDGSTVLSTPSRVPRFQPRFSTRSRAPRSTHSHTRMQATTVAGGVTARRLLASK